MTDRLRCSVPFCRRTRKPSDYDEWVCGPHWHDVPKRLRRLYSLAKRRKKPAHALQWLWGHCKRAAIERAGGIG